MTSILRTPPKPDSSEAQASLTTVQDWLRLGITWLGGSVSSAGSTNSSLAFGHGSSTAHGEVLQLLSWVTRLAPKELSHHMQATLTKAERALICTKLEERLASRTPMAYLLGEAWFGDLRFICDERALVPRSLILEALDGPLWTALQDQAPESTDHFSFDPVDVLDLCTGGASVAIKAAMSLPEARVMASDLSHEALSLAAENIQLHNLRGRITLKQGDLFEALASSVKMAASAGKTGKTASSSSSKSKSANKGRHKRFDLILSNPPYVNSDSMKALPREFRAEPELALAGGDDGMDLIRRILQDAPDYMTDQAWMLVEIGHEASYFEAAFPWLNFSYLPVHAGEQMLVLVSREDLLDFRLTQQD